MNEIEMNKVPRQSTQRFHHHYPLIILPLFLIAISSLLLQNTINAIKYHHHPWRRKSQNIRGLFFPSKKQKESSQHNHKSAFKWIWSKSAKPSIQDCENVFDDDNHCSPNDYEFNHDFVGITNPSQHHPSPLIVTSSSSFSSSNDLEISSPCTSSVNTVTIDNAIRNSKNGFRIIRYKKVIGKGDKTYQIVKNAILQWSPTLEKERYQDGDNWAGIRMIGSNTRMLNEDVCAPLPTSVSHHVMQVCKTGGRRLVTFSRVFGSRLWCMNPCLVIYDVVDEQHESTTFTSTAYATLKGHFLCGEERLTVGIHHNHNYIQQQLYQQGKSSPFRLEASTNVNVASPSLRLEQNQDDGEVFVEVLSCSRPSPGIFGNVMFHVVKNMQVRFFRQQLDTLANIAKDCNGSTKI